MTTLTMRSDPSGYWLEHALLVWVFMSLILIASSACRSSGHYPVDRSIINGLETVMNPDYPRDGTTEVTLESSLIIGEQTDNENPIFNRISDVVVDEAGRIYVLDSGDVKVKVFSSSGEPLLTFGSPGQGPGDFGTATSFALSPLGNILINDVEIRRIEVFSGKGLYLREWKTDGPVFLIGIDQTGILYMTRSTRWDRETGREERAFECYKDNGSFLNRITSIEALTGTRSFYRGRSGFTRTGYEHGAINYILGEGGLLYLGCSSDYFFSVYEANGKLIRKFGRHFKPIPVRTEDTTRIFGKLAPDFESLMPKTKPPFQSSSSSLLEENGRLWVPTFERESDGLTYDVFGRDGIYEKKIFIRAEPRLLKPLFFKAGFLYSIDTDKEGLHRVTRSRVVFPENLKSSS